MLDLEKGTQLADRYTLVRRLGGDTLTHTWLAKDRLTSASVALKISAGDAASTERLRAEWQASIRLMHAHIVRAFEFHSEPDAAFFSQQFIDGPDTRELSGRSPDEILGPIGYIAQALEYLHGKGLVHRDLKASNILLDKNGAPYLSDFGVSAALGSPQNGGSLIARSPQSLAGKPAATSDDVFALGSVIYELLSGRSPWSADSIEEQIRLSTPAALTLADGSKAPQEIESLVAAMLDKDADARPTAREVGERLEVAGFPASAARVSAVLRSAPRTEKIESVTAIRHRPKADTPVAAEEKQAQTGIGRNTVLMSLLGLVAILVAVIFVLPSSIDDRSSPAPVADVLTIDEADSSQASGVENDRADVYVDPEVRRRVQDDINAPTRQLAGDEEITFSENDADFSGLDKEGRERFIAESTLGELLAALEVLDLRGAERWAPREYRAAQDFYQQGDAAYLKKDFAYAEELYLAALTVLEPLYERIEPTFDNALAKAQEAFAAGDRLEALKWFELAVAVTPSHPEAQAGYERAKNLETVLRLVDQGIEFEEDLDLDAAQRSFEQAVDLDAVWQPALDGIQRVQATRTKMEFDTRMSEGFDAIAMGDYLAARAAFRVAQQLIPGSTEPADGLLQVDQGLRLGDISTLELEAQSLQQDEHWDAAITTYEEILKVDNTLMFASDGLANARQMSALHARLDELIEEPDKLSVPSQMQKATSLVVDITTRDEIGPRLASQRDELLRLLKRAATPLKVNLLSDNVTQVSIYKVGRLGNFMRRELELRPGTYVAVGSRPGFRDVRLEFRVAPEIESEPVIVQCEEQI